MTKSALELSKALQNREVSAAQLLDEVHQKIDSQDGEVKSFLTLSKDQAYDQASKLDAEFDKGNPLAPLAGIPISIKDNINITGQNTTCASKMLENFTSPYNATVIEKCLQQGLIPVGKVNMDEFAMGSSTETSYFQKTSNPWNKGVVPGGSSGGSAASVAAGFVPLSLGSDTGGSVRQPAAFCGVVGLKPTYGRVSRFGLVAFASSLDQIGPFSHTVEDTAHLLDVISGHDVNDATSAQIEVPGFGKNLKTGVKGLKIALPKELMSDAFSPAVKQKVTEALDVFKANGAIIEEVSMSSFKAAVATYYIIAPAEASSNLARYDGVRYTHRADNVKNLRDMYNKTRNEGFGQEVKRRILVGTFVLSSGYYDAYYVRAQKARALIQEEFNRVFGDYDIIMSPTTPTQPFEFGAHSEDPLEMYSADMATIPANMAGTPAMSIPCGFENGLPVGLQLMSKAFDEQTLLNVGHTFQQLTDHHLKRPGVSQ